MKRIKRTSQLEREIKQLELRQAELEKKLRGDWNDLKESARMENIFGGRFNSAMRENEERAERKSSLGSLVEDWMRNRICEAERKLGSKVADKVVTVLEKIFNRRT